MNIEKMTEEEITAFEKLHSCKLQRTVWPNNETEDGGPDPKLMFPYDGPKVVDAVLVAASVGLPPELAGLVTPAEEEPVQGMTEEEITAFEKLHSCKVQRGPKPAREVPQPLYHQGRIEPNSWGNRPHDERTRIDGEESRINADVQMQLRAKIAEQAQTIFEMDKALTKVQADYETLGKRLNDSADETLKALAELEALNVSFLGVQKDYEALTLEKLGISEKYIGLLSEIQTIKEGQSSQPSTSSSE